MYVIFEKFPYFITKNEIYKIEIEIEIARDASKKKNRKNFSG